jgi:tetratricopeptide (TPR) repeat protein
VDAFLVKRVKELLEIYDGEKETMLPEEEKWNNKGIIFSTRGKNEEAVEYFEKALEINPRFAVAWNNKGASLAQLGKNEAAITCFDKALEINPEYANPKKGKEIVLRMMKSR